MRILIVLKHLPGGAGGVLKALEGFDLPSLTG